MDLTPGPSYGDHKPITHPSSPKHVWCDGCNRRWPCEVVRAYRAGREDAAKEVPAAQAAAVRGAGDGIREALARAGGGSLTGDQIALTLTSIAREIARAGQHPRTPGEDVTP